MSKTRATTRQIVIKDRDGYEYGPLKAVVVGRLAIHETPTRTGDVAGYTITEISTGRCVIQAHSLFSFQEVEQTAIDMLPLFEDFPEDCELNPKAARSWK